MENNITPHNFKVGDKVKFKITGNNVPCYTLDVRKHNRNNWICMTKNEGIILEIIPIAHGDRVIVDYESKPNERGALNFGIESIELLESKSEIINNYSLF